MEILQTPSRSSWFLPGLALVLGLGFASPMHAASIFLSPSSATRAVGEPFTVQLMVGSRDAAINAVQAQLHANEDILDIANVSKLQSTMSLWVQEPTVSRAAGLLDLAAVVLNPGYVGSGANIVTITFVGKQPGVASVGFVSAQVLANDGVGTNLLDSKGSGVYTIVPAEPVLPTKEPIVEPVPPPALKEEEKPVVPIDIVPKPVVKPMPTPGASELISTTHPDPDFWYASDLVGFAWKLPGGITGMNFVFDQSPLTIPTETSVSSSLTTMQYRSVPDGQWYFHLRLKNSGGWGETAHRRVLVDTTGPARFVIMPTGCGSDKDARKTFYFDATDAISGISGYAVSIDRGPEQLWRDDGTGVYRVPPLAKGKHSLIVRASDKAGNVKTASVEFAVDAFLAPSILDYTKLVSYGSLFLVSGYTAPDVLVTLHVKNRFGREVSTLSDRSNHRGFFDFAVPKLLLEHFTFTVDALDAGENKKYETAPLGFEVVLRHIFLQYWEQYPFDVVLIGVILALMLLAAFFRRELVSVGKPRETHHRS